MSELLISWSAGRMESLQERTPCDWMHDNCSKLARYKYTSCRKKQHTIGNLTAVNQQWKG